MILKHKFRFFSESCIACACLCIFCGVGYANVRGVAQNHSVERSTINNARNVPNSQSRAKTSSHARTITNTNGASRNNSITTSRNAVRRAGIALLNQTMNTIRGGEKISSVRSAVTSNVFRGASNKVAHTPNVSRAGKTRATAIFSDTSKIGSGYSKCRDAYATCMDQFCANANDTFRRCYCSDKFQDFRDKEDTIDQAKILLQQFEDNNLNAVDKSADEVNAMYSATIGEEAIKKDTSGAANILSEIGDLLSGKTKKTEIKQNSTTSLNGLSIDFSTGFDDIFSSQSDSGLFGSSNADMTQMAGAQLYNSAQSQCLAVISESCENDAVLNMAKSSYSIMITQDCNLYQKKIDTATEQVKNAVRTAEKYLRDARLDDFRSHNSADVNECLDRVETAMLAPTACGPNYVKCLDYSGVYINSTTGEPIYSPRLFGLNEIIMLDGTADVLSQNTKFNNFLDEKRVFASSALDSCRTIADTVWYEFKRNALIKISQAQDEKIQEVKDSCVETIKECYDTQSGALKSFDDTTAQTARVISDYAARSMCADKVMACAALYGDSDGCSVDTKTNKVTPTKGKQCGLASLLKFVDTVDEVRVAEGCQEILENYVHDLCTPTNGQNEYPWNCRLKEFGEINANYSTESGTTDTIVGLIQKYTIDNCMDPSSSAPDEYSNLPERTRTQVERIVEDLQSDLADMLMDKCYEYNGHWKTPDDKTLNTKINMDFYSNVFGGKADNTTISIGACVENTARLSCLNWNTDTITYATFDDSTNKCSFTDDWYRERCAEIGGVYASSVCYVKKNIFKASLPLAPQNK